MPGFRVSNVKTESPLYDKYPGKCVAEGMEGFGQWSAQRQTLNKFMHDKAFEETAGYVIVMEGYLLNKTALFQKYNASTVTELVKEMLDACGESFFSEFRGCFAGAVYVKEEKKWIVFTNQIGDNPVFFCCKDGMFAAGSQVNYILDFAKEKKIRLTFNESCAYQMLTYGFVATDETYANEIKRLHGGNYLVFRDGKLEVKQYHRFEKHADHFADKTEKEIVDAVDRAFREAVALEWQKDEEYGFDHLADLSGGLDSRMNIWVAHAMQDRHMTLLTYCKSGYLDETIAQEIAAYWKDELLFKPLDDAAFLYDIAENTFMLGGLSLYAGITGGKRMLSSLNLSNYGIEHTGMVGDAVLGSFYHSVADGERKRPTGMYSERLKDKLPEHVQNVGEDYADHEIFLMYTRGFHGACNSHLLRRHYTEVGSPFLNVDFLQLCFDIPVSFRIGHNIYKKWIIEKYPEAAKYKWEKTGGKITENKYRTFLRKLIQKGPGKILRIFGKDAMISVGMNPLDYWISRDPKLSAFLNKNMEDLLAGAEGFLSDAMRSDLTTLYEQGNALEKVMALTVLMSVKLYFGELSYDRIRG